MEILKRFLTKNVWGQNLLLLLSWSLGIHLLAIFGYLILPERYAPLSFLPPLIKSNFLIWSSANFDGEHYLSIAKFGYMIRSGFPQYAFFPLLPVCIRLLSLFVREYWLAGMLVTQTALLVALVYLRKWTALLGVKDIRYPLLFSSGAIFLASIYTEPLFIALAVLTMYWSEEKTWGKATLFAALATATRVNGIFVVAFLCIKLLQHKKSIITTLLHGLAGITGICSYMLFLWIKTGDPLNWFHAQGAWGKAVATSPVTTFLSYVKSTTYEFRPDLVHLVVVIEVIVTLIALTLFVYLLKRHLLDLAYWIYLAGNIALPLATGSLGSMPRFFLTLFPLLVAIPYLGKSGKIVYYAVTMTISIIGIILFMRGYWYG